MTVIVWDGKTLAADGEAGTQYIKCSRATEIHHLPNGNRKLEIGDTCLDLTLRKARLIGMATAGVSLQFGR